MTTTNDTFIDTNGYISLFKYSNTGVLFTNFEGDITGANPAMLDMIGYTSSELINQKAWFIDHNLDQAHTQKLYGKFKNASIKNVENRKRYVHKNGELVFVTESISIVIYADNEPHHLMSICTKRTDGVLNDQLSLGINSYLNEAIKSSSLVITVIDLDGTVKFVNELVDGISKEQYIESCLYDWLPEQLSHTIQKNIIEIIDQEKTIYFETDFVDPRGVKHFFYNNMAPIKRDGNVIAISFVSNEATELKILEQTLVKHKEIVSLGLEAAEMGVWEWDNVNSKLIWDDNIRKVFGVFDKNYKASFKVFKTFLFKEDIPKIEDENKRAFERKSKYEGEFRILRLSDQKVRWISFKSKFIVNDKGDIIRLLGIAWDNTDIKEIEISKLRAAELERQNIELQQFAYLASHDLKSPLNTISNYSSLLLRKYHKDFNTKTTKYLEFIDGAAKRMQIQIKDLLDYSLLGHGKSVCKFDCNLILQEVLYNLAHAIENSKCTFEIGELPKLLGHKTEILLLFQNLISNAIKFSGEGTLPHISIECEQEKTFWKFSVIDNGIGIEEKYLDRIFTIFERLNRSDEYPGSGIGLAHCKKIVELHSGKIWATSKEMHGSTFHFTLRK